MKKILALVLTFLLVLAVPAFAEGADDIQIAVVLHAMNSSFYTKLADGARAAGEDLGITVDVTSPTTSSNLAEQVALIENCIAAEYDAIATVTWDPSGFNDVIARANEAGIPVIGFNQDAPGCGTEAFIGQDFVDSGYQMGLFMFGEQMGGEGKYLIASCAPADSALVARAAGIEKANAEFPNVECLGIIDIGTDLTNAYGVIENAYLANPDVKAILGVDVFSEAIGTFIAAYGLGGEVLGAGYDLTEGTLQHVKNGDMQLTIGQSPFVQGYYSVMQLYLKLVHGVDCINMNSGAQMVTIENVETVTPE